MIKKSKIKTAKLLKKQRDGKLKKLGVVYLTQIPHGFYEREMRSYFSQFGRIRRLRVARSRKTLQSKGYAYVEFESEDVSKIVADTMNNYLMFDKLIKSRYIPAEEVHPEIFFRSERVNDLISTRKLAMKQECKTQKIGKYQKTIRKIQTRLDETKEKLSKLGIKFQFDLRIPDIDVKSEEPLDDSKEFAKTEEDAVVSPKAAAVTSPEAVTASKKKPKKKKKEVKSPFLMEVHSSEDEITFKTPPNAIKQQRRDSIASVKKSGKKSPENGATPFKNNLKRLKGKPVSMKITKTKSRLNKKRLSM